MIVLAHGFTQTARSWSTFAERLRAAGHAEVRAVDLPGHGGAGDVRGDLWDAADHLVAKGGGPATYIGYSMGGRVALHAALRRPDTVERLVLIGATAGLDTDIERRARRAADEALASHLEDVGIERFVDEWLRNPLFAGLDAAAAGRQDRLRNTVDGLASSLRTCGTGTQTSLWERLGELSMPVLLLVGSDDAKFTAIARRMQASIPDSQLVVIDGAGHSVHLERPDATALAVSSWLDGSGTSPGSP